MKRTKSINFERMRKGSVFFKVKPIALGVASTLMLGCTIKEKAHIVSTVEECSKLSGYDE